MTFNLRTEGWKDPAVEKTKGRAFQAEQTASAKVCDLREHGQGEKDSAENTAGEGGRCKVRLTRKATARGCEIMRFTFSKTHLTIV